MDGQMLQEIRDALLTRWRQIDRSSVQKNEPTEGGPPQAEIIDMAQALEQIGRDSSLAEQERRELLAIERALAKMASGSFGVCEECGDEIPPKRLVVLPQARLCANCQTVEEKHHSRGRVLNIAGR